MYTIQKGVPISRPTLEVGSRRKYPFDRMEVGDSIVVDHERARVAAHQHAKKTNKKFTMRKEGNHYRIWRIQ
jgi:hypothetical protein